jgi:chemotaxis protein CheX
VCVVGEDNLISAIEKSFQDALVAVLHSFSVDVNSKSDATAVADQLETNYSAYIGITGNPHGIISFEMTRDVADSLTRHISNPPDNDMDKMVQETLREITNQLCGHAITSLYKEGYDSNMTPPSIIMGNKIFVYHSKNSKKSITRFETATGDVILKSFLEINEDKPGKKQVG